MWASQPLVDFKLFFALSNFCSNFFWFLNSFRYWTSDQFQSFYNASRATPIAYRCSSSLKITFWQSLFQASSEFNCTHITSTSWSCYFNSRMVLESFPFVALSRLIEASRYYISPKMFWLLSRRASHSIVNRLNIVLMFMTNKMYKLDIMKQDFKLFRETWTIGPTKLYGLVICGVSKNMNRNWKTFAFGRCNGLLVSILTPKLNSGGVSMSNMIFIKMVSKENHLCRCYDSNALVSCSIERVSFSDKISDVGSKFLSQKGFWFRFFSKDLVSFIVFVLLMCVSLMRKIEGATTTS